MADSLDEDRRETIRRESDHDLINREQRARDGLMTALELNDEKHEDAHKRLRESLRDLTDTVNSNYHHFDDQISLVKTRITNLEAQATTPIDATRLVLSSRGVIAVVLAVLAVWSGQWLATAGVRDGIRDVSAAVAAQKEAATATAKLQEVQMKVLGDAAQDAKNTAADAKRQYELLRYEFQALKETVIGKGKTP